MGSRATPSKACEPCRVKRRRCDFKTPCSQCRRAGIECPGYKDAFTLRLRDETALTARKLGSKNYERSKCSRKSSSVVTCKSTIGVAAPRSVCKITPQNGLFDDYKDDEQHKYALGKQQILTTRTLSVLPDQAALSYFMQTYATNSSFFYLPTHYNALKSSIQDTPLREKLDIDTVVTVPALVLLSHELRQPSLLAFAESRYATVLAATQEALADPQEAASDITLASVLLLGLVEALRYRGRCDPEAWDAHHFGAAALLKLRGTKQLQTSLGRQLCLHASVNIRRRCAMVALRMPAGLTRLLEIMKEHAELSPDVNASDLVFFRVSTALEELVALRADNRFAAIPAWEFLQRALTISDELSAIRSAYQVAEPYGTIESSTVALATKPYGDIIRTYSSPRMAKRWIDVHLLRLYLADHVRNGVRACDGSRSSNTSFSSSTGDIEQLEHDMALRLEGAMQIAADACLEILRSVPYLLHLSKASRLMISPLLLPLSSVAVESMAPMDMRSFARETLQYIGERFDIPQAVEAFEMVQELNDLEIWSMIPHAL